MNINNRHAGAPLGPVTMEPQINILQVQNSRRPMSEVIRGANRQVIPKRRAGFHSGEVVNLPDSWGERRWTCLG